MTEVDDGVEHIVAPDLAASAKLYLEVVASASTVAALVLYGSSWLIVSRALAPLGVTPEEVGASWSWLLVRAGLLAVVVSVAIAAALFLVLRGPSWAVVGTLAVWIVAAGAAELLPAFVGIPVYTTGTVIFAVGLAQSIRARRAIEVFSTSVRRALDEPSNDSDREALEQLSRHAEQLERKHRRSTPVVFVVMVIVQVAMLGALVYQRVPEELRDSLLDGSASTSSNIFVVVPKVSVEGLDPSGGCLLLLGRSGGVAVLLRFQEDDSVVRVPADRVMTTACEG